MDEQLLDNEKVNEAIDKITKLASDEGLTMLEAYQCFKSLHYALAAMLGIDEGDDNSNS